MLEHFELLALHYIAVPRLKGRAQSVPNRSDIGKIEKSCYLRAPKELEAHILRIRSTDEYYQHTKYERLTPSDLGDRVILDFGTAFFFRKKKSSFGNNSILIFKTLPRTTS